MNPLRTVQLFWLLISLLFLTVNSHAQTVNVAVATNFTDAMKQIATQFEQETGHIAVLSFASSGKLFAQIKHGAPYDVFLSADTIKPKALAKAGLTVKDSGFTYAQGQLALWSPDVNDFNAQAISDFLISGQVQHIAIANPKLAPYGIAAVETLKKLAVYDDVKQKLVRGENIGQTYQFVASGNAQLGFVALSQLIKSGKFDTDSIWIIPTGTHAPIRQNAVLLNRGKKNAAANALMAYLQSDKAKAIIQAFGYTTQLRKARYVQQ